MRETMKPDLFLLLVVGPSGSGKTTLVHRLLAEQTDLMLSISFTTRSPRGLEENGREYYFVSRPEFLEMIARDEFLEWAEVHGNLYGTSRSMVESARLNAKRRGVVFDIDFQGARQIRAVAPHAVSVFILPPSMSVLEKRLRGRGTDNDDVVQRRMAKALDEISHYAMFDYLIVNDTLERAADELRAIVLAERVRCRLSATEAERVLAEGRTSPDVRTLFPL